MNNYINEKLGEVPIHKFLQESSLANLLWDFDAVSLYPSAMSDPEAIYPRIETCYAFTPDMNDDLVEKCNNQTFTQGSATSKFRFYSPKDLIVQHLPVKVREKKNETNRMRNGYIIDTLTSVDLQENVKIGGEVVEMYESVIYHENFKVSPFKKVVD